MSRLFTNLISLWCVSCRASCYRYNPRRESAVDGLPGAGCEVFVYIVKGTPIISLFPSTKDGYNADGVREKGIDCGVSFFL